MQRIALQGAWQTMGRKAKVGGMDERAVRWHTASPLAAARAIGPMNAMSIFPATSEISHPTPFKKSAAAT